MKATFKFARPAVLALFLISFLIVFAQEKPKPATHGINVANLDRTVQPGDDFYRYANGGWLKRTEIPPDRPAVGVFSELSDVANKQTVGLIEEAAKSILPLAQTPAKLPISTTPTWMRPPSRKRAWSRCNPTSTPSPLLRTSANWPVPWARACAPTWIR